MRKKILVIFGTRPEAIKMAPLVKTLEEKRDWFETDVAVTAQHREMLDQVLNIFNIAPRFDLNIMKERQTLTDITVNALKGLETAIEESRPDLILVHGDTTTTFAGSLAAYYHRVAIGHVEAGLRTYQKYSPYPEEMNRQLTGVLADLHFAPTETAAYALRQENKPEKTIFITGNTVIDALKTTVRSDFHFSELDALKEGERLILMTAHRRENLGEPMERIFRAVRLIIEEFPDLRLLYPVHLNPAVQETAQRILGGHPRIHLTTPLDAIDFHNLMARSHLILTDSGGVQEEAPALGKPVVVLRDTTERPEGIEAGTLVLAGTKEEEVYGITKRLLTDEGAYQSMAHAVNPYGDGNASERIAQAIAYSFGIIKEPPAPFRPLKGSLRR